MKDNDQEPGLIHRIIMKLMEIMPFAAGFLVVGIGIRSTIDSPHKYTPAIWAACCVLFVLFIGQVLKLRWRRTLWYDLDKITLILFVLMLGYGLYGDQLAATQGVGVERHIAHFKDMNPWEETVLWGTVVRDPDIREGKTYLAVKPNQIQKLAKRGRRGATIKGGAEPIEEGQVWVTVKPEIGYKYYKLEYGTKVKLRGNLSMPAAATNPNFFDYKKFLRNQGYSATMTINRPDMIKITGQEEQNFLFKFSLGVKQKFLNLIKRTMPYPESAFLGGVQLGLRGGVSAEVQDDFRSSGVSHVLAVSGLHVTIITGMFWAIFFLLRVPSKISVPIIVFFLLVFTVITGCRPSTSRAAMMNSLALLLMVYSGATLKSSIVFGVSVAAMVVLTNPYLGGALVAFDPGFTLSFVAIVTLALLTEPVTEFLDRHLNGIPLWLFFGGIAIWAVVVTVIPSLVYTMKFHILVLISTAGLIMAATYFQEMPEAAGIMKPLSSGRLGFISKTRFTDMPDFLKSFIGAQGAILLGMMWPLSAYYFQRISLSAPFANLIAIPLIGIIVQIGMIASLLGVIPVIGPWFALMLNAFNWALVKLFLFMAHFFAVLFEYPWVPKPTLLQLTLYYLALLVFIKREGIGIFFIDQLSALKSGMSSFSRRFFAGIKLGVVAVLVLVVVPVSLIASRETLVKMTFLDVGLGDGAIIQIPGQNAVVIDAGDLNIRFDPKTKEKMVFSSGERVVFPVLLGKRINKIDIVMSSPVLPCAGGLRALVERHGKEISVGKFITGIPLSPEDAALPDEEFMRKLGGESLARQVKKDMATQDMCENLKAILTVVKERGIEFVRVGGGDVLQYGSCRLEFHQAKDEDLSFEDKSLAVRIVHDKVSVLCTGYLGEMGEQDLLETQGEKLRSDIIQVPANGAKDSSSEEFVQAVAPKCAVLQFGYNREKKALQFEWDRTTSKRYIKLGVKVLVTDRNNHGAVEIESDGTVPRVNTLLRGKVL